MAGAAPTVTKSPPSLVPPAGPTPGGSLPLSSIDKTAAVRVSVDFIQVFPAPGGGDQASAIATMREGFAKALVPYYPVAGRIAEPVPGIPGHFSGRVGFGSGRKKPDRKTHGPSPPVARRKP